MCEVLGNLRRTVAGALGRASRSGTGSLTARPQRWLASCIVALFVSSVVGVAAQTVTPKTFVTSADSYVLSSRPSTNYGTATALRMKASSPITRTYARFVVSGVSVPVVKATLRVYTQSSSSSRIEVRPAPGSWSETGINYSNAPIAGPVAATSGSLTSGTWVSIDVTKLIPDNGTYSLALTTQSTKELVLSSRETTRDPQLVVEGSPPPPPPPPAPAYYVDSVAGSDANDGTTPATAWQTLGRVNGASLSPGNQVLFKRGGVWNGTLSIQNAGTAVAPIIVGAFGTGALPVINGGSTAVAEGWSCVIVNRSYVHIREIHAQGCPWAGVALKGSNNRIDNSVISDNAAGVVIAPGSSANVIAGNQIVNNNRMSVLTQSPDNDDSGAFGILVEGDGNEIMNNTISGSDAFSYDYGRDGAAVEVYNGKGNNIHHNSAFQNDVFTELGGSRSADNTFAYNLVRSDLTDSIFMVTRGANDVFGPVLRSKFYNNTTRLTGSRSQGFVCYAGCSVDLLSMKNNLIDAAWKAGFADAVFDESNNLYAGGQIQFKLSPSSLVANPLFQDPVAGNLRLRSGSPAIDRGVALTGYTRDLDGALIPVDGNADGLLAVDIGAYEFVSSIASAAGEATPLPRRPEPKPAPRPGPGTGPPPTPRPAPPDPGLLDSVVNGVVGTVRGVTGSLLPG